MGSQMVFQRYEIKFLLTRKQKECILKAMEPYMELDAYGRSTIRNIYYDTDNYRLVRKSLEKPVYKEKLRVRSYSAAAPDDKVFVELKKKYRAFRLNSGRKSALRSNNRCSGLFGVGWMSSPHSHWPAA